MTTDITPIDAQQKRQSALLKAIGLDKVPAEQREIALAIAKRYELDLLLKHLVLIDGKPYITRDGLLWVAHRSGQLDGIEVTDPEVVEMAGIGSFWRATCSVYRKDMSRPFTYAGRYPTKGGNQRFAPEMAVKVAEVMALRRAFNVSAPALEERWDVDTTPPEPQPELRDVIAARRAEVETSATEAQNVSGGGGKTSSPAPAAPDGAGGLAATSGALPSDADPVEPIPAPSPAGLGISGTEDGEAEAGDETTPVSPKQRCPTFHSELGACQRMEGHDGNHQGKSKETWH